MRKFLGVLLLILFFSGNCGKNEGLPKPKYLLPEETYLDLLIEMQVMEIFSAREDTIMNFDSLKQVLFEHYETTEQDFINAHTYYQSHIKEQITRIDTVLARVNREKEFLKDIENDQRNDSLPFKK